MVANFLAGGAVVNAFARQAGADGDGGRRRRGASRCTAAPSLLDANVRRGTRDLTVEPAMTRDEAPRGASRSASRSPASWSTAARACLLTGDMGIANTTPAAALIAAFTGADPAEVTGRGTGIDDADVRPQGRASSRAALARHRARPGRPARRAGRGRRPGARRAGRLHPRRRRPPRPGDPGRRDRRVAPRWPPPRSPRTRSAAMVAGHRSAEPGATVALRPPRPRPAARPRACGWARAPARCSRCRSWPARSGCCTRWPRSTRPECREK